MDTCDVLVVGGGPAGSTCARRLREGGADVVVMDRAVFPRDKVCAGWITPQVLAAAAVDPDEYVRGRTLQAVTGFRTGMIGEGHTVDTDYGSPVSFGIRRCEFDEYLLRRSGARLRLGEAVTHIRREGRHFVVNAQVAARILVGAGGHFCPVARWINPVLADAPLVVAQEAEVVTELGSSGCAVEAGRPEFFFSRDLRGYGWCFRKQQYVNIGLGRLDQRRFPKAMAEFTEFLRARGASPPDARCRWRGHAYLLAAAPRRVVSSPGVVLVGDAAGIAYAQSGEGIRPAVESGLIAAAAIIEAGGDGSAACLDRYQQRLDARLGTTAARPVLPSRVTSALLAAVAPALLQVPWFVRHVVIDRWFLHAHQAALLEAQA